VLWKRRFHLNEQTNKEGFGLITLLYLEIKRPGLTKIPHNVWSTLKKYASMGNSVSLASIVVSIPKNIIYDLHRKDQAMVYQELRYSVMV
jgi:hypothetical protein